MDFILDFSIYNSPESDEDIGDEINENGSIDFSANLTPDQVRGLLEKVGIAVKNVLVAEGVAAGNLSY